MAPRHSVPGRLRDAFAPIRRAEDLADSIRENPRLERQAPFEPDRGRSDWFAITIDVA